MEKKHILLITYKFPPQQTPRAFRWKALVKSLTDRAYKIDILLPKYKNKKRPKFNNVRYFETKQGVVDNYFYKRILKINNDSMNSIDKKEDKIVLKNKRMTKIICSFFFNKLAWPDSSAIWYLYAKKELRKIIKNNKYDCIISSAMPFTSHLLGYYAKKVLKIKWIAEYGDPFSFNPQPSKSIFNFINRKIENKMIKEMDYIIVPFKGAKDGFLTNYPSLKEDKIKIIPQIMPSLISDPGKIKWENFDKSKINFVYAGTFYIPIRSPKILLEALIRFKKENIFACQKIRIHIFGPIGKEVRKIFFNKCNKQLINEKIIILYGETQREVCAFAYQKSDYLLNIANNSEYQLPSKLIEYLSFKKSIISLENAKSKTPNWPFLIKVNYQTENLVNFFKEICKDNFQFSFDNYDDTIVQYKADIIVNKYLNLIL